MAQASILEIFHAPSFGDEDFEVAISSNQLNAGSLYSPHTLTPPTQEEEDNDFSESNPHSRCHSFAQDTMHPKFPPQNVYIPDICASNSVLSRQSPGIQTTSRSYPTSCISTASNIYSLQSHDTRPSSHIVQHESQRNLPTGMFFQPLPDIQPMNYMAYRCQPDMGSLKNLFSVLPPGSRNQQYQQQIYNNNYFNGSYPGWPSVELSTMTNKFFQGQSNDQNTAEAFLCTSGGRSYNQQMAFANTHQQGAACAESVANGYCDYYLADNSNNADLMQHPINRCPPHVNTNHTALLIQQAALNKKPAIATPSSTSTSKKRKKKDANEPQKPVSAYALFFRDTQALIKIQNPSATFGEMSKIVASLWDGLDDDQKNSYRRRTETAKKEYLKQLATYRATLVAKSGSTETDHLQCIVTTQSNSSMTTTSPNTTSLMSPNIPSSMRNPSSSPMLASQQMPSITHQMHPMQSCYDASSPNIPTDAVDAMRNYPNTDCGAVIRCRDATSSMPWSTTQRNNQDFTRMA